MILPVRKLQVLSAPACFLADVIHAAVENLRAAFRAFAQRFLAGEIHRRRRLAVLRLAVAKIKFQLELGVHLDHGGEREIPACCGNPAAGRPAFR